MTLHAAVSDVVVQIRDHEAVWWAGRYWCSGAIISLPASYARKLERESRAYIVGPR